MFDRIEKLIGIENLNKIRSKNILIVGIGGVGGTAAECLVRSGIENITVIDSDTFELSNLNRQILSSINSVNQNKVDVAVKRYKQINENIKIEAKNMHLSKDNINEIGNYDYIIDACDSLEAKIELIRFAKEKNIKIIISAGMGNRLDPSKVYITTLAKTENDPLAKKLRYTLRKENIPLTVPVVASKELPIKRENIITSMMMVPSTAGIYLAHYVIDDIIKE